MSTQDVILKFWKSWQSHSDWDKVKECIVEDFYFDTGVFHTSSANELIEAMKKGNPWENTILLNSVFEKNKGALVYEGVDSITKEKIRISEILEVKKGKVASCISSISFLPD